MRGLFTFLVVGGVLMAGFPAALAQNAPDALPSSPSSTADSSASASPSDISAQIAEKEAEIARLKKQLAKANGKIEQLSTQNQTLQASDAKIKAENPSPIVPPAGPLAGPVDTSSPVASQDLSWYFANTPDVAKQYLSGKKISVRGKLVGFDGPMVIRVFGLRLDSGGGGSQVLCRFNIPEVYVSVFLQKASGTVIGQTSTGNRDVLLHLGDVITVEGHCNGSDQGEVTVSNCRLIL